MISPDDDYIIFKPLNKSNQFHISYRDSRGDWLPAIPFEKFFTDKRGRVDGYGKHLFFGSSGDIYWVKSDFIEALRPKKG